MQNIDMPVEGVRLWSPVIGKPI